MNKKTTKSPKKEQKPTKMPNHDYIKLLEGDNQHLEQRNAELEHRIQQIGDKVQEINEISKRKNELFFSLVDLQKTTEHACELAEGEALKYRELFDKYQKLYISTCSDLRERLGSLKQSQCLLRMYKVGFWAMTALSATLIICKYL